MRHLRTLIFLCCLYITITSAQAETTHYDHLSGVYYTILDSATGKVLLETGLDVGSGDQFITDDNKLYNVSRVEAYTAFADYLNEVSAAVDFTLPATSHDVPGKLIAIYHSHTDEAYSPSDGTASIRGNGTIMKVGEVFSNELTALGYNVDHDRSLHDPHDTNAYTRSRRTAVKLLSEQPAALFDVHRDSAPSGLYKLIINNEPVARIMLVVGRANPYMPTTLDFAKRLKAASDMQYPMLIRGIFLARGHYNQDLNPRSVLVEIGTEGSTLEEAQKSAALFANVIPPVLGGPQDPTPGIGSVTQAAPPNGQPTVGTDAGDAAWRNLFWLITVITVSVAAFLYVSTGSWQGVRQKLAQLRNLEFANLLGLECLKKKEKRNNPDKE